MSAAREQARALRDAANSPVAELGRRVDEALRILGAAQEATGRAAVAGVALLSSTLAAEGSTISRKDLFRLTTTIVEQHRALWKEEAAARDRYSEIFDAWRKAEEHEQKLRREVCP